MASKPPPPPTKSEPGSFAWMDWYRKLYDYLNTAGSVVWSSINFAGSNLTDIAIRLHSSLQGILGTGAYHISAAEATLVTLLSSATGTGNFVRATSPTLVTPALGTPSALVGTNITGTASGLTSGTVTTNANLTGPITSVGNATTISAGVVTNTMLAGSIDLTTKVTGILQVVNGGTGMSSAGPAFSAYQSTLQSVNNVTFTKVSLQSEEFDTNSNFDSTTNYRFTPTVAGYYLISGAVVFANSAAFVLASIYKNGAEFKRGMQYGSVAAAGAGATVSALIFCNGSTDYVELYTLHSFGSAQNTVIGASITYFQGYLARTT